MPHDGGSGAKVRRAVVPIVRGCAVIGVLTAAAYRLHLNSAAAGFIYLIGVVLNCLDGGPLVAMVVSLAAVASLDYFFVQPLFTLTVGNPTDVAALAAFLTTSLVVTGLATKARAEAVAARRDRRHMERLYDLAHRLLSSDPLHFENDSLLETIRSVLQLKAAAFFDAGTAELHVVGIAGKDLGDRTRQAYISGNDASDPDRQTAFRRVGSAAKPHGAIGLEGLEDERHVAGAVSALAATGLERSRTVREAARAAAETQSEVLRGAILDALAHEFKTPLATILTAAGGLVEVGPLRPEQAELANLVEAEAMRLNNLTSHLLRVARLDREDIRARLEMADIAEVVKAVVTRYERQPQYRQIDLHIKHVPEEIPIDVELYQLALSQLLDNAGRYSPVESTVKVTLQEKSASVAVTVWNAGQPIPVTERKQVFDRFYRGKEARIDPSGTGLGLYVARKIAAAHGGGLEFDPSQSKDGIAFCLSVPASQPPRQQHAQTTQYPDRGR